MATIQNLKPDLNPNAKTTFVNTQDLVEGLLSLTSKGEPVFQVQAVYAKASHKGAHLVRVRTVKPYLVNDEPCYPEILVQNAYDGRVKFQLYFGLFAENAGGYVKAVTVENPNELAQTFVAQINDLIQNRPEPWAEFTEKVANVLAPTKVEGERRSKAPRRAQTVIGHLVRLSNTNQVATDVVDIPAKPNKYLYIGAGRTKRPNPAYANWMELYGTTVEA